MKPGLPTSPTWENHQSSKEHVVFKTRIFIRLQWTEAQNSTLEIELAPNTKIHLYGYENYITDSDEPDDAWHQICAGPLSMAFNYQALKAYRKAAGMTQKEVADAVGVNVRTCQKWESKGSVPDGHYLFRIMNWLQIEDVQDLIIYTIPDQDIPLAGI